MTASSRDPHFAVLCAPGMVSCQDNPAHAGVLPDSLDYTDDNEVRSAASGPERLNGIKLLFLLNNYYAGGLSGRDLNRKIIKKTSKNQADHHVRRQTYI